MNKREGVKKIWNKLRISDDKLRISDDKLVARA